MSDRPIPFSVPMVCAILREIEQPGTGKTQTRRVLNPQPPEGARYSGIHFASNEPDSHFFNSAVGPFKVRQRIAEGDRLYVREQWRADSQLDQIAPREMSHGEPVYYEADGKVRTYGCIMLGKGRFRQGMHMPRWASRITLIVTEVRVERLQDCSEADAIAEGIEPYAGIDPNCYGWRNYLDDESSHWFGDPRGSYATLWDSINGPGAWAANPWVAAYTFRPVLGNIDQIGEDC